jgi:tripartite-type tricarboxylate transporter receptor subunit TctC
MKLPDTKRRTLLLAGMAGAVLPATARTKRLFSDESLTWVVGFPAGGGADRVTRVVAAQVEQNLGRPIVVENRPGASSIIAAQHVAHARPDGNTVFSTEQGALIFNSALYADLPYDPSHDFAPVTNMANVPLLLVVHDGFPVRDFRAFIDHARKQPGRLSFGSPGRGLAHHLAMELLKAKAGIDIVDVQYKGIAPVMQDLIGGQVPVAVADTAVALPHLRSGRVRALAAFSRTRPRAAPDVPTIAELGYPEIVIAPIVGVVVPAKTPAARIEHLHREIVRALQDPAVSRKLASFGLEVVGDAPEQFAAFLASEARRWLPFIRSLNIELG